MRARVVCILLLAGCMDKAKADYDRCVERDKNYDVAGAVVACNAAVAADAKSPSGQAAAKKLEDLSRVNDKLKTERDEKAAREAAIKKDDPQPVATVVVTTTATATASVAALAPDGSALDQAQALISQGDVAGARALLEPRVFGTGKPLQAEVKSLLAICKAQKDKTCVKEASKKLH